ncbi:MAG TPA: hypothetical protein VKS60_23220 [Stellaceae bacterium]|nr:hypothetical protein [Stellaceae bacterium]
MRDGDVSGSGGPIRLLAAAAVLILSGCADPAAHWHKPGVADAQRDKDYRDCHDLARDSTQAGVDQDLSASRASTSHGPAGPDEMPGDVNTSATRASSAALIACMTDRGYRGE